MRTGTELTKRSRGRPRAFITEEVLEKVRAVFMAKGFTGASLDELAAAAGLNRPSLYAAFGNKEALFRRALDLYEREKQAYVSAALEEPTARAVVTVLEPEGPEAPEPRRAAASVAAAPRSLQGPDRRSLRPPY